MPHDLAELHDLETLIAEGAPWLESRRLGEVQVGSRRFPLLAVMLGNPDPKVPAVGYFGGVHGLERIGAEVVAAYLRSLVKRLPWDAVLRQQLRSVRLVFMPQVNPGGLWLGTRANPRGVDLMRNAPVDAADAPFLLGGQRISASLPWYRGNGGLEPESAALCQVVEEELLSRRFSLALDCHSGFGSQDRIWFPYAHTAEPIPHLAEVYALRRIFEDSHVHHQYVFEPQSLQYLTHGDLWDHLYLKACAQPRRLFLPMTLEMGSWLWIKKNPRQIFSRLGIFNPLITHRQQRVMRRQVALLDFFTHAACSHRHWLPRAAVRPALQAEAMARWYGEQASARP
jgi:hypothetical protein